MNSLEKIRSALQDRRLSAVANATGIHYNTLLAIRAGTNRNPRLDTVMALDEYLFGRKESDANHD